MTASERAMKLWEAAKAAALLLESVGAEVLPEMHARGSISLGVIPDEVMHEIAALAGVEIVTHRYADGMEIDGFRVAVGRVDVHGATAARVTSAQVGGAA